MERRAGATAAERLASGAAYALARRTPRRRRHRRRDGIRRGDGRSRDGRPHAGDLRRHERHAAWAPNGSLVYAARTADGPFTIPAAGSIRADGHLFPAAVAGDGRIAALQTAKDGHTSLAIAAPAGAPRTIVSGPFDVMSAAFSPDGGSIAYESDETGRREIYLRHIDSPARTQVSTAGGERPSWSADGRAVFFHEGARFVRVSVNSQPAVGSRDVVLDRPDARAIGVAPNGRLLVERQPPPPDGATVILQWLRELQQRSPLPVNAPR